METKQAEADLILKLYEIRREDELRKAREWFDTKFNPENAQEIINLVSGSFFSSAYFRMVLTYWEMVAGLVEYGALDANLVHKTNVEHLRYFAKIEPFLEEVRKAIGADFAAGMEKLAKTVPEYEKRMPEWRELNKNWTK